MTGPNGDPGQQVGNQDHQTGALTRVVRGVGHVLGFAIGAEMHPYIAMPSKHAVRDESTPGGYRLHDPGEADMHEWQAIEGENTTWIEFGPRHLG